MTRLTHPRDAYRLETPRIRRGPLIIASPHSGRFYPESFCKAAVLDAQILRSSEDAFVDLLVADAPDLGVPLLSAVYPRAYVDLNRSSDELDPAVISGLTRIPSNPRITSGLGVIPRVVSGARQIYRGKMPLSEAEARLNGIWHPYHDCLMRQILDTKREYGQSILLDMHSMPSEALANTGRMAGRHRPDVVLGDRFGASAGSDVMDRLETAFRSVGLKTSRNSPFAGAFITQHYGRPAQGQHAIQVEIDRALYMNESLIRPTANFDRLKSMLNEVMRQMIEASSGRMPMAAE